MEEKNQNVAAETVKKQFGGWQVFGLMLIAVVVTVAITVFVFKTYLFPSEFKPVTLNQHEQQVLAAKLENLDAIDGAGRHSGKRISKKTSKSKRYDAKAPLKPEPYSEKGLKREVNFTERELNALLAKNTDLARKLAIDLSDGLISAKLILPVDEDFPVFGGKTLRVRAGVVFSYSNGRPVVILKGVTVMGVPIPNAWLGGIKNIDLVKEFGADRGFWKAFSDGVKDIKIEDGVLKVKLKK